MELDDYTFNAHNKEEFPPAHTAEHLLNQLMVRMFGTERSKNAHIERKKSKMTFVLEQKPTRKDEKAIADEMNKLIDARRRNTRTFAGKCFRENKTRQDRRLRCVPVYR